ncbi:NAD(P)H-flavin oxidoreductase [Pantoea sp. AS-PWVM4]|uniref:flavin reductase family protein n=1 Tax=Pantoea sp. AS-PWVM4 TaxID=1332069 RepID=UPI0003AC88F8|nr:flavin reductase family protein [Pantoea sp. AS-PWVM4]ERK16353.1 NAD(P)H-flavin oxidoreductase [Pantoea sp. AS-PWVM4]
MNPYFTSVELEKAYRLINHGPATLVSASHDGIENVMAASWVCGLDFTPAKLTVVLDKSAYTRQLIEKSNKFVIQVPNAKQAEMVHYLGTHSKASEQDKLSHSDVECFYVKGIDQPFVSGCSAWLYCELIPLEANQRDHDLFIGEVKAAWADSRIFQDGHWLFESAGDEWRSLHYIAGKHFYKIGEVLDVE